MGAGQELHDVAAAVLRHLALDEGEEERTTARSGVDHDDHAVTTRLSPPTAISTAAWPPMRRNFHAVVLQVRENALEEVGHDSLRGSL
ncbi:MAG: hypothetical protein AB2L07_19015 [Thermoanaerobaculaceae bacterium]